MREYRLIIIALLLLAMSVTAFETVSTASGKISPLDQTVAFVFSPFQRAAGSVGAFAAHVVDYGGAEKQQADLQNEVYLLQEELSRLQIAQAENARLRAALQFKDAFKDNTIAAEIVGRDPSEWFDALTIDRGLKDGVRPDQGVIGGGSVLGKIWEVSGHESRVALVTNPRVAIPVEVLPSGAQGIVYGKGEGGCEVRFLPLDAAVKPGDKVVTSGLGHVFHTKGIPIGAVTSITQDPHTAFFRRAEVNPFASDASLRAVLVVTP